MSFKTQTILCIFFGLSCLARAVAPPPAESYDPNDPPQGIFSDEWMEMKMGPDKVGWTHTRFTRKGNEIHTDTESYMVIARGVVPIKLETQETTVETVDGTPLRFKNVTKMSGQELTLSGVIKDGRVTLNNIGPGYTDTREYAYPKGALMDWGVARETFERGFEPGTEYTLPVYSPDVTPTAAMPTLVTIGAPEFFAYLGEPMRGPKITMTLKVAGTNVVTTAWADEEGRLLVSNMTMMGIPFTSVVVDRETAMADFVPAEFFVSTFVQLNRSIPEDAEEVVYALSMPGGDLEDNLPPESLCQQVSWDAERGAALITVTRPTHMIASKDVKIPLGEDIMPYMQGNVMITSESPAVVDLLKQVSINPAESALEKAYALTSFVSRFIQDKNLEVGFASAAEVVENPVGDCTEHAVLLAALGRAEGIPSRVAAGLIYAPEYMGHQNIMGYHMWTQFCIGGQWLDFDATRRELKTSPIRIAFNYTSLADQSLAELGLGLMDKIGQVEITVESVTTEKAE